MYLKLEKTELSALPFPGALLDLGIRGYVEAGRSRRSRERAHTHTCSSPNKPALLRANTAPPSTCSPLQTSAPLSRYSHAAPSLTRSPSPGLRSPERLSPCTQAVSPSLTQLCENKAPFAPCPSCLSAFGFPCVSCVTFSCGCIIRDGNWHPPNTAEFVCWRVN